MRSANGCRAPYDRRPGSGAARSIATHLVPLAPRRQVKVLGVDTGKDRSAPRSTSEATTRPETRSAQ